MSRALLVYGKNDYNGYPYRHPFITLHEVVHESGGTRLAEGQLVTPKLLSDLLVGGQWPTRKCTWHRTGTATTTVLSAREPMFWGLGWRGSPQFLDEGRREETDLVIGCVDSRKARRAITKTRSYWDSYYWLDLGNNADTGQFVLGQPANGKNQKIRGRLPTVAELFPEIINPKLDKKDKLPSCSAVEALEQQEPFVNQVLAYQALAMLARLFRYGQLSHQGGFVNLHTGRTTALPVQART